MRPLSHEFDSVEFDAAIPEPTTDRFLSRRVQEDVTCSHCTGRGKVEVTIPGGVDAKHNVDCPLCLGKGKVCGEPSSREISTTVDWTKPVASAASTSASASSVHWSTGALEVGYTEREVVAALNAHVAKSTARLVAMQQVGIEDIDAFVECNDKHLKLLETSTQVKRHFEDHLRVSTAELFSIATHVKTIFDGVGDILDDAFDS